MLSRRRKTTRSPSRSPESEFVFPPPRLKAVDTNAFVLAEKEAFDASYLNVAREESSGGAGAPIMTVVTATMQEKEMSHFCGE